MYVCCACVLAVKALLLEVLANEPVEHIRKKACHTIAELATTCARWVLLHATARLAELVLMQT